MDKHEPALGVVLQKQNNRGIKVGFRKLGGPSL